MPFHCDITYNYKGIYDDVKNKQVESTQSVIISLGDSRELNWQKQILMVNCATGRLKWLNMHKSDYFETVELGDKTIHIVNTTCERPQVDHLYGCLIRYQHGHVNVTKGKMSCGLVLRVVKNVRLYNQDNHLLSDCEPPSGESEILNNSSLYESFHKEIKSLFFDTFKSYKQ